MYCQACGAENTEDARFCNMCGSRFAQAGEAGGPIAGAPAAAAAEPPPAAGGPRNDPNATVLGVGTEKMADKGAPAVAAAAGSAAAGSARTATAATGTAAPGSGVSGAQSPFGGDSMLGVTLGGIGVQSAKKTWLMILAIALGLVAISSLATWLATRGGDEGGGHAEADDPFVLGMPLTDETESIPEEVAEGDPTPEDIDFVTGRTGSSTSASSGGSSGGSSTMRGASTGSGSTSMSSASSGGSTTMASSGGSSGSTGGSTTTMAGSTGGSSGSTGGSTGGSSTMASTGGSEGASTGGGSTGGATTGTTGGGSLPTNTDTAPEERDLELELYGSRVRYVVRRYYAGRAQNCFDRATRNDPSVSGTVVVAMTIGAEGQVTRARVQRNTTGNETLGNCLSSNVGTWRLPPPPGGSLDMTMPFSR